ncbi:MAG: hypothetical protein EON59_10150 [Alphaproteobacteria bacterium]|nr:MAG: hypothetical protein EON59_10150 [Alphaproteobacteria bacterium]
MSDEALVDTDVLLKTISYRLANATLTHLSAAGLRPKVLGAARYMLASHIGKARRIVDGAAAAEELALIAPLLEDVEPTAGETALAAELEVVARTADLAIDGGESQLLAILILRAAPLMLTGDKRAIRAIGRMVTPVPPHRIACLEQLLGSLADSLGPETVRSAVCAEPLVDKSLLSACGCASPAGTDPRPGLESYVEDLRKQAPAALCEGRCLPV